MNSKFKSYIYDFKEVVKEQNLRTKQLSKKHPWYPIAMNWLMVILIIALVISCVVWHMDTKAEIKAMAYAEEAVSEYQAELDAMEQAKRDNLIAEQMAEKTRRENDILLMAKAFAGIDKFVEKYRYNENDIRTYGECMINRVINQGNGFPDTLSEVIMQESQWTGFSDRNQVIDKYYEIAKELVNNFYDDIPRPCSADYCWAELRKEGIFLKNEFSDSNYVRTWRY